MAMEDGGNTRDKHYRGRQRSFNTRFVIPSQAFLSSKGGLPSSVIEEMVDGEPASLFEVRELPLGCDARWARPVRAPCLRNPKLGSQVVLVVLCWSPAMK